jgi:hypothetical protein
MMPWLGTKSKVAVKVLAPTSLLLAGIYTSPSFAQVALGVRGSGVPAPAAEWILALDNTLPRKASGAVSTEASSILIASGALPRTLGDLSETDRRTFKATLLEGDFTVELWLLDHVNQFIGATLDSGQPQAGSWVLGYRSGEALFGPIDRGGEPAVRAEARDGFKDRWHHVMGVREGRQWRLYVDGALAGEAMIAGSPSAAGSLHLTGYLENERFMKLPDLVKAVAVYDRALAAGDVASVFKRRSQLVERGILNDAGLHFTQPPYLNSPTTSSIELSWETDRPVAARVEWGERSDALQHRLFPLGTARLGGTRLEKLKPDTPYFYRVSGTDATGQEIDSGLLSFRTAPGPGTPFTIAVSGDTEARTHVNRRMSELIWEERPNLLLLAGDLTDGGSIGKRFEWTHEYFAGMGPLFGRLPVVAAPGNGESELHWFRHYHRQPGDEAFFSQVYGDAEIFVLDSNLDDRESREPGFRARQRAWLQEALLRSTAKWKIAIHHHAIMSTDDDDYGDSWTETSQSGDPILAAEFQPIYEAHGVDLVIQGHLHTYERSWPIRGGQVDPAGVTYVQVGGMGGNLEDFQPTKPWFNRKTVRDHHYLMLRGAGDRLEAEVYDAEGRRRDAFVLQKD